VVQLLHGIKIYSKGVEKELVTPTGAAVISTLCSNFGEIPPMNVESCGCGAGDRDLEIPNLLRIYVGQLEQGIKNNLVREGKAVKIEANIDDMNPQFYEYISQRLFSAGAADVYMQTAFMKKNRIGNILCVNTCDENMDNVLKVIFEETTTIGVKVFNFHKYMLPYEIKKISTKLGEFSVKVAFYGDRVSNISPEYEEGFRLECRALKKVREEYGLTNVWAMLPFVRTTWELVKVKEIMASEGLVQGNNFKLWIMAEVPSVVFEAEEFAQLVDGFSIGSNDLTQLIMGADRDSGILNNMGYFDERNEAVKKAISILIKATHKYGKTISICGQGPSQYPEFAEFLVQEGIDSMSVNPDTVNYTRRLVASVEQRIILKQARKLK
jgi:hypothetical protein